MINKETYSYEVVEKISFTRWGGTDEEKRAAEILMNEITSNGGTAEYMEFKIPAYECHKCTAKVVAPFEKELEVIPYGISGQLPEGGVTLNFRYIESSSEASFYGIKDLSDTAVLINALDYDMYRQLIKHHAAAFIVIHNLKWWNTPEDSDLMPRPMRAKMLELGKIPGFSIRSSDATEIVRDGAEKIHLELREDEFENTSRDILAVIPGTEIPEESIVITGHYDSVLFGTGSWDNATGAATLMYLYQHFLKNPPKRTLRFIWCGSEEQGLLGSKAYVEQHPELLDEIKFCFNFDMNGTIIGQNSVSVTGGDDLKSYAEQICNEAGYSANFRVGVHSSDSAPFADKGIPAIGLSRGTRSCEIHTRNDLIFPLSPKELYKNGEFAIFFITRVANSTVMPIKKGMPDDMKKQLDKYFQRDKKPD
jgi:hypothetical protein